MKGRISYFTHKRLLKIRVLSPKFKLQGKIKTKLLHIPETKRWGIKFWPYGDNFISRMEPCFGVCCGPRWLFITDEVSQRLSLEAERKETTSVRISRVYQCKGDISALNWRLISILILKFLNCINVLYMTFMGLLYCFWARILKGNAII